MWELGGVSRPWQVWPGRLDLELYEHGQPKLKVLQLDALEVGCHCQKVEAVELNSRHLHYPRHFGPHQVDGCSHLELSVRCHGCADRGLHLASAQVHQLIWLVKGCTGHDEHCQCQEPGLYDRGSTIGHQSHLFIRDCDRFQRSRVCSIGSRSPCGWPCSPTRCRRHQPGSAKCRGTSRGSQMGHQLRQRADAQLYGPIHSSCVHEPSSGAHFPSFRTSSGAR